MLITLLLGSKIMVLHVLTFINQVFLEMVWKKLKKPQINIINIVDWNKEFYFFLASIC